jgi:hypothetical protein
MIDADKLNALVDDELDSNERAEVEAMITDDPHAMAELGGIRLLKTALQDHVRPVPCEDEWRTCVKRLNEIDRASKTRFIVDRWAWAMCSVLFAFIITVGLYNRTNSAYRTSTGDLTRASMGNPVRDVLHMVKDQFGKAPVIPRGPLRKEAGWIGTVDGHRVARILLKDNKGEINCLVLEGQASVEGVSPMDDGLHASGQTGDATTVTWSENGLTMVLTAPRDAADLRQIAETIHVN